MNMKMPICRWSSINNCHTNASVKWYQLVESYREAVRLEKVQLLFQFLYCHVLPQFWVLLITNHSVKGHTLIAAACLLLACCLPGACLVLACCLVLTCCSLPAAPCLLLLLPPVVLLPPAAAAAMVTVGNALATPNEVWQYRCHRLCMAVPCYFPQRFFIWGRLCRTVGYESGEMMWVSAVFQPVH